MRGLFAKAIREVWFSTLLFGSGLLTIMALLTYVLPQVLDGMDTIFAQMPFVKTLIAALIGSQMEDQISAQTMQAFLWVHPVVLSLIWAHEIVTCTRMPSGEIDRGTIDVLLGMPVSRRAVYLCESAVWLGTGLLILSMGLLGHRFAATVIDESMRPDLSRVLPVMLNLFCVYIAVGGIAYFISSLSDRRGRAMAFVFGILLASFLLNFLAQFWEPAQQVSFLSVMHYYRPAPMLLSGELPASDLTVLATTGLVTWLLGMEIVARRSIRTV